MSSPLKTGLTPEGYLQFERSSSERHEYLNGEVFLMGGASERHNLIVVNVSREISMQFRDRPCKVYVNDMRVKVSKTGMYTYPDVAAVCGPASFDDGMNDTLVNPTLIMEVLSPSTEAYDRGRKFEHYRQIESLAEYLLVSSDKAHIERYFRSSTGEWTFSEVRDQDSLRLYSVECTLTLANVYEKVEFP